jgi:hypothetical protein
MSEQSRLPGSTVILEQLQRLLAESECEGDAYLVAHLALHGLCVDARARSTPAEPDGKTMLSVERLLVGLGSPREPGLLVLPAALLDALLTRGLGSGLDETQSLALAAWDAYEPLQAVRLAAARVAAAPGA